MKAGRGATTIKENSKEAIINGTKELFLTFVQKNYLKKSELVSVIFTATKDITKAFPARAVRELGFTDIALLDMEQKIVDGDLKLCIRMLVFVNVERALKSVYIHGAVSLRKDLKEEK